MLFIILCRIFYLQFFQYDALLEKAKQNWDREIPFMAERGEIVDRNGEKLVTNELAPTIYFMPAQNKVGSGSSADWFIKTYKQPGITMEISPYVGDTTVPLSYFADIWNRNKTIGLLSALDSENF